MATDPSSSDSSEPGAAQNIEIKARVSDLAALRARAEAAGAVLTAQIAQRDTFFPCAEGRLKLRDFGDGSGELIRYARPDSEGPKTSTYRLVPTSDPQNLRAALSEALGVLVEVRKQRELWMSGRTRIHLDRVEGLGDFLELEVVLAPGETHSEGEAEARELMRKLGVASDDLVAGAYADLLTSAGQS